MEKLNKEVYIKRIIVISWIVLAICFIIKLFGGNLFEIICKNETFIAICEFCDNNWWARYLIGITNTFLSTYLFCSAILAETKYKLWQLLLIVITVLGGTALKLFYVNLGWIFDCWQMIILPIIFLGKRYKEYYKIILANILLIIFQAVSLLTKNLGLTFVVSNGMLITFIYCIDITIMLLLYCLYAILIKTKKGGGKVK